MNFYFFSLFVVLCFGPWPAAGEVYFQFSENSAGATLETKSRKSNGESNFSVINGLIQVASHARTWTQWLRRLLKALRKWFTLHPPEVKLAKCLAAYYNFNILGPRRYDKIDGAKETNTKKQTNLRVDFSSQTKSSKKTSWAFLEQIKDRFKEYRDAIFSNEIFVCVWDYVWKKFWIWVDTAPDSRC